jgi:hypothetical protein
MFSQSFHHFSTMIFMAPLHLGWAAPAQRAAQHLPQRRKGAQRGAGRKLITSGRWILGVGNLPIPGIIIVYNIAYIYIAHIYIIYIYSMII